MPMEDELLFLSISPVIKYWNEENKETLTLFTMLLGNCALCLLPNTNSTGIKIYLPTNTDMTKEDGLSRNSFPDVNMCNIGMTGMIG